MNKQMSIVGVILIILLSGLSGCIEQNNDDTGNNELEVVSYSIVTEAYSYNTKANKSIWKSFGEGFKPDNLPEISSGGGVYLPEEYYKARYRINVTVKNIADRRLDTISVILNFYDSNDTLLISEQIKNYSGLPDGHIWDFEYEYDYHDDYFERIDHLEILGGIQSLDFKTKEEKDIG